MGALQKTGLSDMRNVNIISVPGEVSVGYQTTALQQTTITAAAYTVVAATDVFTYSGTVLKGGTAIVITVSTGSAGITSGNTYWVRDVTSTTFKVGTGVDSGGTVTAAVNVTSDGTGTFTTVDLAPMQQFYTTLTGSTELGGFAGYQMQSSDQGIYGVDSNGRAWVYNPPVNANNWVYLGNSTINASPPRGNGITVWNGYILVFRAGDRKIDYRAVGGASSTGAWTYGWQTTGGGLTSRTFRDVNDTVYWASDSYVGSLIELTNFDPANAATYTISLQALAINPNDIVNCIDQLGSNLIIGGMLNFAYLWDKSSTGYTSVLIPEAGIARIVTVNSNSYLFAGNRGRIYVTNGANVELYQKVPDHLSGTIEPYFAWGDALYSRNQLYFSCSAMSSATLLTIPNYGGIWAISTDTNAIRLVNKMSYGTYAGLVTAMGQQFQATTDPNSVYGVAYPQASIISGWTDGVSAYGSDYIPLSPTPYSNYEAYIDSDMIPVGTYLKPHTDANVEFKLTVPTVTGEGVKLAYRQNFSSSFTDITNGEFTTAGTLSGVTQVNFQKSQWLQIRCYLKSTSSSPSYTRLSELRIR